MIVLVDIIKIYNKKNVKNVTLHVLNVMDNHTLIAMNVY
jgi:hypothetical protein